MFRFSLTLLACASLGLMCAADQPKPLKDTRIVPKLPDGMTPESLAETKDAKKVADWLDKEYPAPQPESVRMLAAILRGSQLGGNDGWFGPAQTRYTWKWLADSHNLAADAKGITQKNFHGTPELFDRLDRDGDGSITSFDLDWGDRNPYAMQLGFASRLFRRLDSDSDGKLTREDLDKFFKMASQGKDYISPDDLRKVMVPRGGFLPGDAPKMPVLVKALFAGEIGSMGEGPRVGDVAPDFTLKSPDGKDTVTLSTLTGAKPVVLVLGNFTCGPFRGLFPEADALYQRYKDQANFLMVYVREAHPTDGWSMDSNSKAGVSFKQPTTQSERGEICEVFRKRLKPGMQVVVDDISDPVGNAYSGMPARMYVLDAKGKVAYKNGRGPFGFKPGEMEQALVMALVEAGAKAEK